MLSKQAFYRFHFLIMESFASDSF